MYINGGGGNHKKQGETGEKTASKQRDKQTAKNPNKLD